MRKNILTIVIMAATVVNLILTIIMVFSIMPAMNKTNRLVDKVAAVIDMELEQEEAENYSVENLEPYEVKFENKQTINLTKEEGDKESHYVIIDGFYVSFNKEADDYKDIYESVQAAPVYVTDCVKAAIAEQTISTLNESAIKELALAKIQEFYNSKCIVQVSLSGYMYQ